MIEMSGMRIFALGAFCLGCFAAEATQPDLFIGTRGLGHVSPAAAHPFGLVQAGPDTSAKRGPFVSDWAHTCGYQHGERFVQRFSQSRLSGTGVGALGEFGILPVVGEPPDDVWCSELQEGSEYAEPGYYAVTLKEGDVRCEMSALAHSAAYRFAYGSGERMLLLFDPGCGMRHFDNTSEDAPSFGRQVYGTSVGRPTDSSVEAHTRVLAWIEYDTWLRMEFSRPVVSARKVRVADGFVGERWVFDFGPRGDGKLEVRLALSLRSQQGANGNLAAEMPTFDFDRVRMRSAEAWQGLLSRVELDQSTDPSVAACFRTSLYRLFLQPNDIADVGDEFYSTFSLWDTFRAAHPLYTILSPERVNGFVRSFLRMYDDHGYLPIWAQCGKDNHCMIGHHAVPVLVDAYLKGFRDYDHKKAWRAVSDSLRYNHVAHTLGTWGLVKEDWDVLDRYGYYPCDLKYPGYRGKPVVGETVSRTLECAYDDACAARFAAALGKKEAAAFFAQRAGNWSNVLDRTVGLVRGRCADGSWRTPYSPFAIGLGPWADCDFTEGNAWQYTWHVVHDPDGLVSALGGKAKFGAQLERLFTLDSGKEMAEGANGGDVSGLIGQYAHGNEPSHHTIYFFRWSDRSWLTDKYVREVFETQYFPRDDGLCGNEDCGQMSAWYVFSTLGFYPFDPCGSDYVIGAPQVPGATIHLPGGKKFRVMVKNFSKQNIYGRSVSLNGRPITDWRLPHASLMAGGELVFTMAKDPR